MASSMNELPYEREGELYYEREGGGCAKHVFNNLLGGPYLTAEVWRPLDEFENALRERGYRCERLAAHAREFYEPNCLGAYQYRPAHSAFHAYESAHM
eukprot:5954366-Amphidinium_carterae.1